MMNTYFFINAHPPSIQKIIRVTAFNRAYLNRSNHIMLLNSYKMGMNRSPEPFLCAGCTGRCGTLRCPRIGPMSKWPMKLLANLLI